MQPIADIVITVLPDINMIWINFAIDINSSLIEKVFDSLVDNRLGLECSIGKQSCSIAYTRIWRGGDVARELRRLIEAEDQGFTVYCQIEGVGVARTEITS
jgi:hypothetical protein